MRSRLATAAVALTLSVGCGFLDPAPAQVVATAAANMKSAGTFHMSGTGSFALRDDEPLAFDFTVDGDANLRDGSSRVTLGLSIAGRSIPVEQVTADGKTYVRDAQSGAWGERDAAAGTPGLSPLANTDLSAVRNVVEIDRPILDGRQTRHFSYSVSQATMEEMKADIAKNVGSAASNLVFRDVDGRGEIWIRTDDARIVRQIVRVFIAVSDGTPGAAGATSQNDSFSLELNTDIKFSKHGESIPSITSPPTTR